jgi:hypothetical protein
LKEDITMEVSPMSFQPRIHLRRAVVALALFGVASSFAKRASEAPIISAGSKSETDNYLAEIASAGAYKAGAEGNVKITLVAKGKYHINGQYPYKFKTPVPAPEGITYPKPVLARADGTFDQSSASFQLPFVASKAGKAVVGGTFFLSVCSEANCLVEKVPLEIGVDVK